jgi:hypothetical protein
MPSWLNEAIKLLGFSTPFIYGFAVYKICYHFDKRGLSRKGRISLSSWLEPKDYKKKAVGDAVLESFDRVYSRPLLSFRTFGKSALITSVVTVLCIYEGWTPNDSFHLDSRDPMVWLPNLWALVSGFLFNIISDYVGLFLVRRFLVVWKNRPVIAVIFGPMAGIITVLLFFSVRHVVQLLQLRWQFGIPDAQFWFMLKFGTIHLLTDVPRGFFLAGLLVHLWLPLLALAVGFLRALNFFRLAVGMTQNFLAKGALHPLEAIGYVAGGFVFVGTAIAKLMF